MAAPSALVLHCDTCGDTPHRVLRGKVTGKDEVVFEGVVKCSQCGQVRSVVTREPRPIQVPLVISFLESSERTSLEFAPDEEIELGQELELGDTRLKVTAIEVKGRRLDGARAKEVTTLWAKRTDRVRVKFSVNMGNRTVPHDVLASPDEEFEVGDIVDLGRARAVVHHIRTQQRTVHDGRVRADEIVRMYGRVVRERTSR
ncbi:MAG TPA: HVO_0476 family zinc finger protein [Thermoplasmata archaeon]|nr:HVO_0476 family zinc finger protein [Thermoplasmata archaeon]